MFEVTGDDIAALNDEDLRSLVGLLCEAELRSRSYSASAATWGGNQNAADGGLDVRVALPLGVPISGFIPRPVTGYQVKKSNMHPNDIKKEMILKGLAKSVIAELAGKEGAYVIVSSGCSASETMLSNRLDAMASAVSGLTNRDHLELDFYDSNRMATWVRQHPGLFLWVKQKIGRPVTGWQSYDAWACPAEGVRPITCWMTAFAFAPVGKKGMKKVSPLSKASAECASC